MLFRLTTRAFRCKHPRATALLCSVPAPGQSFSGSVIPDLLVGFAADLQHLLPFELQLFSQSADILIERVDLVVQLSDVVLPPGDLVLHLGDPAHQLPLLTRKQQTMHQC